MSRLMDAWIGACGRALSRAGAPLDSKQQIQQANNSDNNDIIIVLLYSYYTTTML